MSDKISQFDLKMLQVYPFLLGAISFDYYRTYLYLSTCVHLNNYSLYIIEKSKNFLLGGILGIFTFKLMKNISNY
jgi:hypothetical protein